MDRPKPTPETWTATHDPYDGWYHWRVVGPDNEVIANVCNGPTAGARARLFAAATELLAACERIIEAVGDADPNQCVSFDPYGPLLNGIRDAITKATQPQPGA